MVNIGQSVVVDRAAFGALLGALIETGHELVGPTVRDGAIVLGPLSGIDDLAATELVTATTAGDHHFVIEVGSDAGAQMLARVAWRPASAEDAPLLWPSWRALGRSIDRDRASAGECADPAPRL